MKTILNFIAVGLVTAAVTALPLSTSGQTNQTATTEKKAAPAKKSTAEKKSSSSKKSTGEKKHQTIPFHGELTAVDIPLKTITVGKRTFQITSETRIYRGTKTPATLEQGVVGEPVRGAYRKGEGDKLVATSVYFGAKTDEKAVETAKPAESQEKKAGTKQKK